MATEENVNDALVSLLTSITTANGYSYDFVAEKIMANVEDVTANFTDPENYPKALIGLEESEPVKRVGGRVLNNSIWSVALIGHRKQNEGDEAPKFIAFNMIKDFKRALFNDVRLSGDGIRDSSIVKILTDSGYTEPEAVTVILLQIQYEELINQ